MTIGLKSNFDENCRLSGYPKMYNKVDVSTDISTAPPHKPFPSHFLELSSYISFKIPWQITI